MSIFNDRIVLKDGTVIMPNEIHGITTNGAAYGIELHDGSYMVVAPNKIRTDRPTGMVDSTGKEIYERDILCSILGDRGAVVFRDGMFEVKWDTIDITMSDMLFLFCKPKFDLIVTGMVPWEDI